MKAVQMMCEKIDTGKFTLESKFVFDFAQNFYPTLRAIVDGNDCSDDDKKMLPEVMQSTLAAASRVCTKVSKEYMQYVVLSNASFISDDEWVLSQSGAWEGS